jgi:predicted amidohydrolase YtcJ
LILTGGKVKTPQGWVEAVAISDGVIAAVGDSQSIKARKAKGTQVVELDGKTVLPGLGDMHVHSTRGGLEQIACKIPPGSGADVIAQVVAECAAASEPGVWVTGGNWVAAGFEPGQQNRAFLDKVAPDNPVALFDESHHSLWVNSAALELAGIAADTPNPDGGVIDRDSGGEATGLLRETAMGLVLDVAPPATEAELAEALHLAGNQMLAYGITSFTDAGPFDPSYIGNMSELSGEGKLQQRVRVCMRWTPLAGDDPDVRGETLINSRANYEQPRLLTDCVKIVLDGVPTESRTAVMLEPYFHEDGEEATTGLPMIPSDILNPAVAEFDRQGLHVKFHAAGDGAVRQAIDAVAFARAQNGWGGPPHDVCHNSFVNLADIPRVRDLEMTWEFSPYIWFPTPISEQDITRVIGEERMKRWIPIKDALETDARVVAGSDWPVVPSVNPWLAIETMVTRQVPGGGAKELGSSQKVTLEQAMSIFTENAAEYMGMRDKFGSIEPGMLADIIVVEKNPYEVPITEVHKTKVLMTFINGEKVFDLASPPRLTAD